MASRAEQTPQATAFTFEERPHSYAALWQGSNQFANLLQQKKLRHQEPVVLVLPNSVEFFHAFYGVQCAGGTAVPIFPGFSPSRILTMARLCHARFIILPSTTPAQQRSDLQQQVQPLGLELLTVADSATLPATNKFPAVHPDDIAFIQYTSGSTGNPKGVQLSHANLLTNVQQMIAGWQLTADDVFVSWLPVYHDMGLIAKTMLPFYLGAVVHLLPTSLRDVRPWLAAIAKHRATFTAAPDFAYRLCLRQINDPQNYDLSSLRIALNAAEPVRAQTMEQFEATFGLQNVMIAGYGLAEATVGVSSWPPNQPMLVDNRGVVSIGRPFPGITIRIINDNNSLASAGEVGEICISSPANTRGYYDNPKATADLFLDEDTIRSGDLGYLDADGNLFIVGRKKNMIIQAGSTLYAAEIEEVVNNVTAVRYAAAVGMDSGGIEGETVAIVAEIRDPENISPDALQSIVINIVQAFHARFGFRPGHVFLAKPNTIPMTYNGKLQHGRLQTMLQQKTIQPNIVYPPHKA